MKIKLFELKDYSEWHDWFALYPVIVLDGEKRYFIWFEKIQRRRIYAAMYSVDQYRLSTHRT